MKVRKVQANNRRRAFEVSTSRREFEFPYVKCDPRPGRVVRVYPDAEIGREGFTYELASGIEGTVLMDQVLEYNRDPQYLREQALYRLTLAARDQVQSSDLTKREITRRLGTSASQLARLLDQTNYQKSVDQLLRLLEVLGCEVEFQVREPVP